MSAPAAKCSSKARFDTGKRCRVCGDRAAGFNFGVVTCESCKVFFRRNCQRTLSELRCAFNGACAIDIKTRRLCKRCRLGKCIRLGMAVEPVKRVSKETQADAQPQWTYECLTSDWTVNDRHEVSELLQAADAMLHRLPHTAEIDQQPRTSASFLALVDVAFRSVVGFARGVADFGRLPNADQVQCLKRAIGPMVGLRATINFEHVHSAIRPNALADAYHLSLAELTEHAPQLALVAEAFLSTFDVEWAGDVPMLLQLMMTLLFAPAPEADYETAALATELQQKWVDRLKRYLLSRHAPDTNKALSTFKCCMSRVHEAYDTVTADTLRPYSERTLSASTAT